MNDKSTVSKKERAESLFSFLRKECGRGSPFTQKFPISTVPFTVYRLKVKDPPQLYLAVSHQAHLVTILILKDAESRFLRLLRGGSKRSFTTVIKIYGGKISPESEALSYIEELRYYVHDPVSEARFFRSIPVVALELTRFAEECKSLPTIRSVKHEHAVAV